MTDPDSSSSTGQEARQHSFNVDKYEPINQSEDAFIHA